METTHSENGRNPKSKRPFLRKISLRSNTGGRILVRAATLPFGDFLTLRPIFSPIKANPDVLDMRVWAYIVQVKIHRKLNPLVDDIFKLVLDEGLGKFLIVSLAAMHFEGEEAIEAKAISDINAPDFDYGFILRYVNSDEPIEAIFRDFCRIYEVLHSAQTALHKTHPEIYRIRCKIKHT